MTPATKTLDSVEEQCRADGHATFVSGSLRIDCRVLPIGSIGWVVDGHPCSRSTAEAALEAARADKDHPFNWRPSGTTPQGGA